MAAFHVLVLRFAVVALIAIKGVAVDAQTSQPTNRSASMVLNFRLENDHVVVGQSPVAILIVDNIANHYLFIYDEMYRVHVEGKSGEAPTTLSQRCRTGMPRTGDVCLPTTLSMGAWAIFPGTSDFRKLHLDDFYDLSAPGRYIVYAEVMDPTSQKWLRTKTIQFETQAPTQ